MIPALCVCCFFCSRLLTKPSPGSRFICIFGCSYPTMPGPLPYLKKKKRVRPLWIQQRALSLQLAFQDRRISMRLSGMKLPLLLPPFPANAMFNYAHPPRPDKKYRWLYSMSYGKHFDRWSTICLENSPGMNQQNHIPWSPPLGPMLIFFYLPITTHKGVFKSLREVWWMISFGNRCA